MVLFGSYLSCTRPGTFSLDHVVEHTPEGQTMRAESVDRDSARGRILWGQMYRRLRGAAALVARRCGLDCIVSEGDVRDARGLPVRDVTSELVQQLR
ncbi:MAG: hypothetical protein ACE37K_15710 [Planctomycetota bacterium]